MVLVFAYIEIKKSCESMIHSFVSHGKRGSNSKEISLSLSPSLIVKLLRFGCILYITF